MKITFILFYFFISVSSWGQEAKVSEESPLGELFQDDWAQVEILNRDPKLLADVVIDLCTPYVKVILDKPSSSLLFSGKRMNVDQIVKIVKKLDVPVPQVQLQIRCVVARNVKDQTEIEIPDELGDVAEELKGFWDFNQYELKYKIQTVILERSKSYLELGDGILLHLEALNVNRLTKTANLSFELRHSFSFTEKNKKLEKYFDPSTIHTVFSAAIGISEEKPKVLGGSRMFIDKDDFVLLIVNSNFEGY